MDFKPLKINIRLLIFFIYILAFDGLLRLIFFKLGIVYFYYLKDVLFVVLILCFGLINFPYVLIHLKRSTLPVVIFLIYLVLLAMIDLFINPYSSFYIFLWGFKTSFMYLLVYLFFLDYSKNDIDVLMTKLLFLFKTVLTISFIFVIIQLTLKEQYYSFFGLDNDTDIVSASLPSYVGGYLRINGLLRSANSFGLFLITALVIMLAYNFKYKNIFITICVMCIMLSLSRMAIVCMLLVFIINYFVSGKKIDLLVIKAIIIFPYIVVFAIFILRYIMREEIEAIGLDLDIMLNIHYGSFMARIMGWLAFIENYFNQNIWHMLFGKGLGYVGVGANILTQIGENNNIEGEFGFFGLADSIFFYILGNFGLFGLTASYFFTNSIVVNSYKMYILKKHKINKVFLLFFPAIAFGGLFGNTVEAIPLNFFIMLFVVLYFLNKRATQLLSDNKSSMQMQPQIS